MDTILFEKRQTGWAVLACVAIVLAGMLILARPNYIQTATIVGLIILIFVGVVFSSMTVQVTNHYVSWCFEFGLFKRKLTFTEICDVRTEDLPFYSGYGIRVAGGNQLWRVSGTRGVALTRRDGTSIILGTSDPEGFTNAIMHAMNTPR